MENLIDIYNYYYQNQSLSDNKYIARLSGSSNGSVIQNIPFSNQNIKHFIRNISDFDFIGNIPNSEFVLFEVVLSQYENVYCSQDDVSLLNEHPLSFITSDYKNGRISYYQYSLDIVGVDLNFVISNSIDVVNDSILHVNNSINSIISSRLNGVDILRTIDSRRLCICLNIYAMGIAFFKKASRAEFLTMRDVLSGADINDIVNKIGKYVDVYGMFADNLIKPAFGIDLL